MDSISQALWGSLSAEASTKESDGLKIRPWLMGLVGGTLPDLDSFLKSSTDPLFSTLMHRHFTHSIFFIPIGALVCWLLFWPFFRKTKEHYGKYYRISLFAYGTHWILDLLTSYGTQIFWPLSTERFSLDWVSIVDPIVTVPWLIAFILILIFKKNKKQVLKVIFLYTLTYFAWTGTQEWRAEKAIQKIAEAQGHQPERIRVFPSLGNSLWFRGVYLFEGQIYSQGVLVPPHKASLYRPGTQMTRIKPEQLMSDNAVLNRQIRIWNWFVDDWMYAVDGDNNVLGDGRYTMSAEGFDTLWALSLNRENPKQSIRKMLNQEAMVKGRKPTEGFDLLFNPEDLQEVP